MSEVAATPDDSLTAWRYRLGMSLLSWRLDLVMSRRGEMSSPPSQTPAEPNQRIGQIDLQNGRPYCDATRRGGNLSLCRPCEGTRAPSLWAYEPVSSLEVWSHAEIRARSRTESGNSAKAVVSPWNPALRLSLASDWMGSGER